jgi:hypothetical protein
MQWHGRLMVVFSSLVHLMASFVCGKLTQDSFCERSQATQMA